MRNVIPGSASELCIPPPGSVQAAMRVLSPDVLTKSTTAVIPTLNNVDGLQFALLFTVGGSAVGAFDERPEPGGMLVG